jgi:hypothetical protein
MSKIDEIKMAVVQLPPEELEAFRVWFEELQEQQFDDEIERDVSAGKLDKLAEKWRADHKAGKSTDL